MKEGVEATLIQHRTYMEIQLNSGDITQKKKKKTELQQEKILKTLYTQKNHLQHNLPTPAKQNTRRGGWSDPQLTSSRERPIKERPNNNQNAKTYREPT